ncbi:MAG TPA: hydantoinase/oxoprolinase family protein [Ktedonobacteraceae bacterium]|nr:hydantoinase/oxoprolinase family protein [Ktedonobacteraceae bacterium]
MSRYRVSVDIGGTFTDFVVHDQEQGYAFTGKVLSTPTDPARGVITGLTGLIDDLSTIDFLVHGTTVGLNAFLERRGSRVLLITTAGFRDVYTIARGDRKKLYALQYRKPEPLIPPHDIHTVHERVRWDGSVQEKLHSEDFEPIIEKLQTEGIKAVAICFLHAYVNPEHELQARKLLQERVPGLSISLSHEIAREWREYERSSSTVLNAYVAPIVERYLSSLEGQARERGLRSTLYVMQSNGGVMTASAARGLPIQTFLSGPVGGTIGGQALSQLLNRPNLLCVDMGGTSFDASLIINGQPSFSSETALEGLPILMSLVDIHTIGAGGGSLAWLEAGALRVGPRSAGADPGPACYGLGGTQPTVTDANLFLGRMNPDYFLGGHMKLDRQLAGKAIGSVADQLGLTSEALAEGMLAVVNARMADAMRTITVKQGIDPREYSLLAFGGAGPMHAVALAKELDINEVIIPWAPGTFSAWGMLQTNVRHDLTRTFYQTLQETSASSLESMYGQIEEQGRATLYAEEVPAEQMGFQRSADMRYIGQEYSVNVPVSSTIDEDGLEALTARFHDAYKTRYGHSTPGAPIEFVNLRVAASGKLERRTASFRPAKEQEGYEASTREVIFEGQAVPTKFYRRDRLPAGTRLTGPHVIEEETATTVVPPGWISRVDELGNIIITPKEG